MDEDDRVEQLDPDGQSGKSSRRERFKGTLARARSKFKRNQDGCKPGEQATLPDDVDDFLAAGRTSISSSNWNGDALSHHTPASPSDSLQSPRTSEQSTRPSTSDSFAFPKQSPRRIVVPRIDVSNAQRFPGAQPVDNQLQIPGTHDLLQPEYQSRSQSATSLSKRKGRARGLSVTFIEAPPIVIGEGGDDAPAPPMAISQARARARSVSPFRPQLQAPQVVTTKITPPPPNALHTGPRHGHPNAPGSFAPRPLQRVPTAGPAASRPFGALDREFEMTLQLGSANGPLGSEPSPPTVILAPKPIRHIEPPDPEQFQQQADADARAHAHTHVLKREEPSTSLRTQFQREGDTLRAGTLDPSPEPTQRQQDLGPMRLRGDSNPVSPERGPPQPFHPRDNDPTRLGHGQGQPGGGPWV